MPRCAAGAKFLKQNGGHPGSRKAARNEVLGFAKETPMTLEAVLAALHLVAILTFVVFLSSQAALCRMEWMNAAVVERLARLDVIYGVAGALMIASGVASFWPTSAPSVTSARPMRPEIGAVTVA
eukprot:gene6239-7949_t